MDLIEDLGLPRRHLQPLVVDAGHLPADLPGRRLHHAVRRRLDRLRREVAAPPRVGRPPLLLGHRLRRRHQRPRRAGRPARRRRAATRSPTRSRGLGGVAVDKQRAGERVYDINVDGVAQYGLYPDWIEDLRMVAGAGDGAAHRSTTWRAAPRRTCRCGSGPIGIAPDSCRNPGAAQVRGDGPSAGAPGHDHHARDARGRPAVPAARHDVRRLRAHGRGPDGDGAWSRSEFRGRQVGRVQADSYLSVGFFSRRYGLPGAERVALGSRARPYGVRPTDWE